MTNVPLITPVQIVIVSMFVANELAISPTLATIDPNITGNPIPNISSDHVHSMPENIKQYFQ